MSDKRCRGTRRTGLVEAWNRHVGSRGAGAFSPFLGPSELQHISIQSTFIRPLSTEHSTPAIDDYAAMTGTALQASSSVSLDFTHAGLDNLRQLFPQSRHCRTSCHPGRSRSDGSHRVTCHPGNRLCYLDVRARSEQRLVRIAVHRQAVTVSFHTVFADWGG